jgi:hypothetical protein
MKVDKEYEIYFFRTCTKYQNLSLWLKPLESEGFFDPAKNPVPVEDPNNKGYFGIQHWQVLDFLEAVSIQNKDKNDVETTETLLRIANRIIEYKDDNGLKIDNYRTDWYVVKIIFNLPHEYILIKHIEFIGDSLRESKFGRVLDSEIEKVVLPVLLRNNMKSHLLVLLELLFDFKAYNNGSMAQERKPLIEEYHLHELLERHSKGMTQLLGVDGLEILIGKINSIVAEDEYSFSMAWISTIEDHPQNHFPKRYDNQLIRFTRDLLESLSISISEIYISKFLTYEEPIYKRLAFHILNINYSSMKTIFWQWFDENINQLDTTIRHEFYKLLSDNSNLFSDEEMQKIITWIESLDYSKYYESATEKQFEKITANKRREWLLTIKEHSSEAEDLYKKYSKLDSSDIEHPGFDMWSGEARWISNESPISDLKKFSQLPICDIASFIIDFDPAEMKSTDPLQDQRSFLEGLGEDLEKLVTEDPLKYSKYIKEFSDIEYIFKCYYINGLEKAWKEKKDLDWHSVLTFLDSEFTESFFLQECSYSQWFKQAAADLITSGTRDDENAFNPNLLPLCKNVLFKLINHRKNNKQIDSDDLASYALNSVDGKSLKALLSYTLRYGRINSSNSIKWEPEIKEFFTTQINEFSEYSKLLFFCLGWYLPQIQFLDKEWVKLNFNKIFPIQHEDLWELSFSGYFRFSTTVYEEDYNLFLKSNHFDKALGYEFSLREVKRKLIDHLSIMFMNEKDDSTILKLINSRNIESNSELVNSVYYLYRNKPDLARSKVIILWNEICKAFSGDNSKEISELFSSLSKWFVFIDKVDVELESTLFMTAKNMESRSDSYFLVDEMNRLSEKNINFIGRFFLEILENGYYPTYEQDVLIRIVEKLFLENEEDLALRICNKYRRKGIYIFNEVSSRFTMDD